VPYARPSRRRVDDLDDLDFLLFRQRNVLSRAQALRHLTAKAVQHRLECGRWEAVHRAVYLTQPGPLAEDQRRWVAALATGGVLGGLSALAVLGLRGHGSADVHVLLAARRDRDPPIFVVVHRTRTLPGCDVHRVGAPPCTMPARSLVDAAQWARTADQARAVIAAGFQQRLVAGDEVHDVLARMPSARRRALIAEAAADARGGVHSLPESEFLRLCRSNRLPVPTLQIRREADGRRRYIDAYFERWRVHVEIDGAQHMDVQTWWADMKRQNELWIPGDRVLRFRRGPSAIGPLRWWHRSVRR
jgi:very-short-patch-repair endonuclease